MVERFKSKRLIDEQSSTTDHTSDHSAVAAIYFAALGPVEWAEGFVMAVGAVAGGYYGAGLARRLGRTFVRRVVMVIGLAIVASMLLRG